ncbi:MAG: PKD domain-containing protein [Candidatus Saliniplasma sp.]
MIRKYLTTLLVVILVSGSFLTAAAPDHEEGADENYFLVRDHCSEVLERVKECDFTIIEEYDNFVLIKGQSDNIFKIQHNNIVELEDHTNLYVKGRTIDISSKDSVYGSENSMFLIRMHGPIKNEWRRELENMGVNILNYVPNYAFHVRMDSDLLRDINDLRYVSWVGEYEPEYKLDKKLTTGMVRIEMINSEKTVSRIDDLTNVKDFKDRGKKGEIILEIQDNYVIEQLSQMDDVLYIENVNKKTLNSEMESQLLGGFWDPDQPSEVYRDTGDFGAYVNHLGYNGDGIKIAIADSGLGDGTSGDAGHDDFTGRVFGGTDFGIEDDWSDGRGHGTHTAGLAAGDTYDGTGLQYEGHAPYHLSQGLAYGSELYAQRLFDEDGSWSVPVTVSYYDIVEDAKQNDVFIHSNSWGEEEGDGYYESSDSQYDEAVRDADSLTSGNQPMVIVSSAGNDGPDYESIGSPGNAKNVITVGATESYMPDANLYGSSGNSNDPYSIPSFSSRGWTKDNRVKPTVVAPGMASLSTSTPLLNESNFWGLYSEDERYEWASGTSQSTPTISGATAVISQYYLEKHEELPTPAMVKAFLINSAMDLETDHSGDGEIDHIPNKYEGWGLVDLTNIIGSNISYVSNDQESLLETGEVDEYSVYPDSMDEPLKISLTWTDEQAEEGDAPTIKNDLNLEVISPSGKRYNGNAFSDGWTQADTDTIADFDGNGDGFDNRNVVENVYIHPDELEDGFYDIRIEGYDIPADANNDGTANQDYALLAHNSREVDSDGSIHLDQDRYALEDTVNILVMDGDLGGEENIEVDIISDTEPEGELVELTESEVEGVFTGSIDISENDGEGTLQVAHDDTIEAVYQDEDIGNGTSETKSVRADVDGIPPEISDVDVTEKLATKLSLTTSEPAVVSVNYGIGGEMNRYFETESYAEDHELLLDNLVPGRIYDFKINVTDEVGNWKIYDNEGEYYSLNSSNIDDVEEGNIGWTPEDEWKTVQSDSYSGDHSWNFGQGNYETRSDRSLISPRIDISRMANVKLSWYHIYDFEDGYDGGIIEADFGSGWEKLVPEDGYDDELATGYDNTLEGQRAFTGTQDEWREEKINISEDTDSMRFRFRAGTDTHDTNHEGWWIDDIKVEGAIKPTANFTYDPKQPTLLDDIQFYDTSYDLDGDVNYTWEFGDGDISYENEPTKRYDELGSYDVTLTVKDESGMESSVTKTIEIVNILPRPDFIYEPERPTVKDDIEFIDDSHDPDGDVVEYYWDFDDGNVSDGEETTHSYSLSGTYQVTLVVWDNDEGENYTTKEVKIENLDPVVSFNHDLDEVYTDDEVDFEDESFDHDGRITNWTWDFGDGRTSHQPDPSHVYEEPGEYRVSLTVEDNMGAKNGTHTYVNVLSPEPQANFTFDPEDPKVDEEVRFVDDSTERKYSIESWEWDLGDGTVSEEQNPTHVFKEEGEYTVSLTVTDEEGNSDTVTREVVVERKITSQWWFFAVLGVIFFLGGVITWYFLKYRKKNKDSHTPERIFFLFYLLYLI